MGHKVICLSCRKSFSKGPENLHAPEKCSECGNQYITCTHRFRPPPKDDLKAWKLVSYYIDNGFLFQHIYQTKNGGNIIRYPDNIEDAKTFVVKYKDQAIKTSVPPSGG